VFDAKVLDTLGLGSQRRLLHRAGADEKTVNFLTTGIQHADALTTVSVTYAKEIQTPELGAGLEHALRARSEDLHGIVNGVDYGDWDPATDTLIPFQFSIDDMSGKAKNKQHLLDDFSLDPDPQAPLLGVVSRLTGQKGLELLFEVLPVLLQRQNVRFVLLGSGEQRHEKYFQWLRDTYPTKAAFYQGYNNALAHRIEAACDLFLMPSRYEPCGLNQMYSLRYGAVPVVRKTGGLADTVIQYDSRRGEGTGFLFTEFRAEALHEAIRRALAVFADQPAWQKLVRNGMGQDFSWQRQGLHYELLYQKLSAQKGAV
jgi:starch synthase